MARRPDPDRIRNAQLFGSARALNDVVSAEKHRSDFARKDWPELWERIDQVIELAAPATSPTF